MLCRQPPADHERPVTPSNHLTSRPEEAVMLDSSSRDAQYAHGTCDVRAMRAASQGRCRPPPGAAQSRRRSDHGECGSAPVAARGRRFRDRAIRGLCADPDSHSPARQSTVQFIGSSVAWAKTAGVERLSPPRCMVAAAAGSPLRIASAPSSRTAASRLATIAACCTVAFVPACGALQSLHALHRRPCVIRHHGDHVVVLFVHQWPHAAHRESRIARERLEESSAAPGRAR